MAMTTIQAPWVNLVIRTMTSTSAVVTAPSALTASARLHPPGRPGLPCSADGSRLSQCRTMPAWLRVKETNTPMM